METTIIITVLITLGSVALIGGLITLGVVVYKLSKNKLSRDDAGSIESEIYRSFAESESEINKKIDELFEQTDESVERLHRELEQKYSELVSIVNSRCDKLYEKIKESK